MVIDIFNSTEKYGLILADPPWKQSKGGKKAVRKNSSGMELDYPVCFPCKYRNGNTYEPRFKLLPR